MKYQEFFSFWNSILSVSSNNKQVIDQLSYIYRPEIVPNIANSAITYYIDIHSSTGENALLFGENIENGLIDVSYGKSRNDLKTWKSKTTILPPISLAPLVNDFTFIHGCALLLDGKTHVIFGPSRSGKTTFILSMLDKGASLISDDIVVIRNSDWYLMPFPKAVAVRNTNDFYFQPQLNKLRMAAPESLRSIYIPKLGLDSYLIHIDSVPGWTYSPDPLKIDYIYLISDDFESNVDLLAFIQYLLAQGTLSDSSYVTTLVHIFDLLQAPPFLVDIRNHEKMFRLLNTHHLPTQ